MHPSTIKSTFRSLREWLSLVARPDALLGLHMKIVRTQLNGQTLAVDGLEQTGTEFRMDRDRATDDPFRRIRDTAAQ